MAKRASLGEAAGVSPGQGDYVSALFKKFCGGIAHLGDDAALLDLGPSTTGNVMHWVRDGHSVTAFDLLARPVDDDFELDHPDNAFGGVLGWTTFSQLSHPAARRLTQEVGRVLRPDGWIFAVFDGDGRRPPPAYRYRIVNSETLGFEPIADRPEPRVVLASEIETLLQPFRELRIMVMRHGSREVLGRRP